MLRPEPEMNAPTGADHRCAAAYGAPRAVVGAPFSPSREKVPPQGADEGARRRRMDPATAPAANACWTAHSRMALGSFAAAIASAPIRPLDPSGGTPPPPRGPRAVRAADAAGPSRGGDARADASSRQDDTPPLPASAPLPRGTCDRLRRRNTESTRLDPEGVKGYRPLMTSDEFHFSSQRRHGCGPDLGSP